MIFQALHCSALTVQFERMFNLESSDAEGKHRERLMGVRIGFFWILFFFAAFNSKVLRISS